MRAQGIFKFYLDFVLPRAVDSTNGLSVTITHPAFKAVVTPWLTRDSLFPDEIDETLSAMQVSLRPADGTEGLYLQAVEGMCLSRINVILELDLDLDSGDLDEQVYSATQRAVQMADHYLDHLRVAADSSYVKKIGRSWNSTQERFVIEVPYTVLWFNLDADGERLGIYQGVNGVACSGALSSPETGHVKIADLQANMIHGGPPPLYKSLLVDADEAIRSQSLRQAVLAMASAIEIVVKGYFSRHPKGNDTDVRRALRDTRISFAGRYLDVGAKLVDGTSLADERPEVFAAVERMYKERNHLMHQGDFDQEITMNLKQGEIQQLVQGWLVATRTAIEWVSVKVLED